MPAMPACRAVKKPILHFVGIPGAQRLTPATRADFHVIGVEDALPTIRAVSFFWAQPGVLKPALIVVVDEPVWPGRPDDLRHGIGQLTKSRPLFFSPSPGRFLARQELVLGAIGRFQG